MYDEVKIRIVPNEKIIMKIEIVVHVYYGTVVAVVVIGTIVLMSSHVFN